jgi:hypothetical protein
MGQYQTYNIGNFTNGKKVEKCSNIKKSALQIKKLNN